MPERHMDPEYFQAITDLHADRIGHGYHLFSTELCGERIKDPEDYVRRLARFIADRRITIEVCITSNLQRIPPSNEWKTMFSSGCSQKSSLPLCVRIIVW